MTNADILKIAMKQSALDANCSPGILKKQNTKLLNQLKTNLPENILTCRYHVILSLTALILLHLLICDIERLWSSISRSIYQSIALKRRICR